MERPLGAFGANDFLPPLTFPLLTVYSSYPGLQMALPALEPNFSNYNMPATRMQTSIPGSLLKSKFGSAQGGRDRVSRKRWLMSTLLVDT